MKQILISLAALALMASCQKFTAGEKAPAEPQTAVVTFLLEDASLSRATSNSTESSIEKAQVAVYNAAGTLLAVGDAVNGAVSLRVPVGESGCSAFALANAANDLAAYGTRTAALHLQSTLGGNRSASLSGLEMGGLLDNITFTENYTETISLVRYAAKVEIDEIVNAIPGNPKLTVKGIYLINVNSSTRYDFYVSALSWKQKRAYAASETTIIPYTADIFEADVNGGAKYDTPHYFYCYQNPTTTDSSAPTWSARFTRLVVEASYSGTNYYYPVNIRGNDGKLNANTAYIITRLTITGPGSDSPDKPVTKAGASFNLSVAPWESGISQEVEI
ncbi:MAG: hypothetical protein IJS62_04125 [Bacteroidales bacterium]|nr:hypothetical protein [Bacteroidales bacterium]